MKFYKMDIKGRPLVRVLGRREGGGQMVWFCLQRTVTRFAPPMVQVKRVRSQPLLSISSMAVGARVSVATTE